MLPVGKKAPLFTLPDAEGKKVNLSDFQGRFVVLYFYPRDNTPGCTLEAIQFTQSMPIFSKLGCDIVGISNDSVKSHCGFRDKHKLEITLLSDETKETIKKYDVWHPKVFMGREFLGIVRTTYLIDPSGKVAYVWPKVSVAGHVDEVLKKLKEIQKGKK